MKGKRTKERIETPTPMVDEKRASETSGTWADGSPCPADYAFGVQVGRRDAFMYGAHNLKMPDHDSDYTEGYRHAVADAKAKN